MAAEDLVNQARDRTANITRGRSSRFQPVGDGGQLPFQDDWAAKHSGSGGHFALSLLAF